MFFCSIAVIFSCSENVQKFGSTSKDHLVSRLLENQYLYFILCKIASSINTDTQSSVKILIIELISTSLAHKHFSSYVVLFHVNNQGNEYANFLLLLVEVPPPPPPEPPRACEISPCLNGGTCIDEPRGQYQCICRNAYHGRHCGEGEPPPPPPPAPPLRSPPGKCS